VLIYTVMSMPLSRLVALALAVLIVGTAASASARPKKHSVKRSAEPQATVITSCDGTPIIMQGIECKKRPAGGAEQATKPPTGEEEQATKPAPRPRVTRRGSGGLYAPAHLSPPTLGLSQPSAAPYIPPPVANPSAQINQLNHSFPLNGGLGLNPTNRDSYIRYNLTR
jgi:hypothetical protein